ncbi:flagellar protein FliT [Halomonas nitroreducens]|uniref:Flagellar protein FliT n=1 Tax=Halomonas nitroreducens TaxID=447425 RepID=A0A3S0KRA5_9GAMM|nr:flagellar protein FliT [Halomonas nitroreducens]RTR04422.1 flagellar protein FliT [Halomonas nitroreducens]
MVPAHDVDSPASQEEVIAIYEALLARSEQMLASARVADWAALVDQEADYVQRVERLSRLEAEPSLDRASQLRKADLLECILENDLEVRRHLIQRRDELGELIGTSRRQQSLQRAYGAGVIAAEGRFTQGPA